MRSGVFALSFLTLTCFHQSAFAVVLAYEGFDYPNDAAPVIGLNGGTGWSSPWGFTNLGSGFTTSQDDTSMSSPAFPYTAVGDRALAAGAGTGANNMRVYRSLPSDFNMANDGVMYASFLFQKINSSTATANNNLEFQFIAGDSGNGTVRFGATSANQLFLNDSSTVPAAQEFGPITLAQTYFVVLKLESFAATNDVVSALVFDPAETVPAAEPGTWDKTKSFNSALVVNRVRLWIGTVASGEFDEIRLGQTWGDVTNHSVALTGDYNGDGKVDAADYVIWRKTDSGNLQGYTNWRANYGQPGGSGAALGGGPTAVPEPSALSLLILASGGLMARRRTGPRVR